MNKVIFIDSNIFIEAFKKNGLMEAQEIWKEILNNYLKCEFVINLIVKNEVSFHLYTKRKLLSIEEIKNLLNSFKSLKINEEIENLMFQYMKIYSLKPNDALILATCKYYGISYLISLDEDFIEPTTREGIYLIRTKENLCKICKKNQ